jgi:hypothetical protein
MKVSEIIEREKRKSEARLNDERIAGNAVKAEFWMGAVTALQIVKHEVDVISRQAAKVEKVEPGSVESGIENCHKCGGKAVVHWSTVTHDYMVRCPDCGESCAFHLTKSRAIEVWNDTQKHQAAKPKPASVPTGSCYGCLKFNPPYCTMIGSIAPHDAGGCASKETPKDNPQTAGEGAIAIATLADVPIGAVAVLFHHQHLPTSGEVHWLVVGKANGNVYVGLSSVFRETVKIKKWYWPQDAVNRMREGK